MRILASLAAVLLLAGCLSQPAPTTSTATHAPAHALAQPRNEDTGLTVDYTLKEQNCGAVGGNTYLNGGPNSLAIEPQKGDKGLRVTFTWASTSPLDEILEVALLGNDTGPITTASGKSPLVLTLSQQDLADAGAPDSLTLSAEPGGSCGQTPTVGSAQGLKVKVALAWNPPS